MATENKPGPDIDAMLERFKEDYDAKKEKLANEEKFSGGKVSESNPLRIVTWFWNDPNAKNRQFFEWTPDHVHKLAAGFKKHLHIPHEFCAVTDRGSELDSSKVRIIPMWDDLRSWGRCFPRLKAFSPEMYEVIGPRFVSVDLDTLIVGDVTPIFDRPDPFVGYRDSKNPLVYSGALWMKDYDAENQVWETIRLVRALDLAEARYVGSDQCWLTTAIGPKKHPRWSREDGIYDFWNVEGLPALPANSRIIFFNGMRRDMSMKVFQDKYPWINEHWTE